MWLSFQPPNCKTVRCLLSATAYSIYSQLPSISGGLHPQPEDTPCYGDRDPLNMVYFNASSHHLAADTEEYHVKSQAVQTMILMTSASWRCVAVLRRQTVAGNSPCIQVELNAWVRARVRLFNTRRRVEQVIHCSGPSVWSLLSFGPCTQKHKRSCFVLRTVLCGKAHTHETNCIPPRVVIYVGGTAVNASKLFVTKKQIRNEPSNQLHAVESILRS
jgi:hypothetical protein